MTLDDFTDDPTYCYTSTGWTIAGESEPYTRSLVDRDEVVQLLGQVETEWREDGIRQIVRDFPKKTPDLTRSIQWVRLWGEHLQGVSYMAAFVPIVNNER